MSTVYTASGRFDHRKGNSARDKGGAAGRRRSEKQQRLPLDEAMPKPPPVTVDVGAAIRAALKTRLDRRLFITMFIAVTVGVVCVFSASFPLAGRSTSYYGGKDDPYKYLRDQVLFMAIGLVLTILVSYVRPSFIKRIALIPLAVFAGLMGLCVVIGQAHGGAAAWLGERGQPSEFGKLAYLLYIASVVAPGADAFKNRHQLKLVFGVMAFMCLLLVKQNDLGMAMLIVGITFIVLFLRGAQLWFLGMTASGLVGAGSLLMLLYGSKHFSHVLTRVEAWLQPQAYLDKSGGHIANMLATISRGGLWGEGLGMCGDKWKALFAPHTDAIFCVICGETGLWGPVALLTILALIAAHCFRIAGKCKDQVGWLFASSIGAALGLQTLINVAVATNCIPCTGLTLPFISAGGSSLIASMVSVGVVLAVGRYSELEAKEAQLR